MITQQTLDLAAGSSIPGFVSVVAIEGGGSGWLQWLKNNGDGEGRDKGAMQRTFQFVNESKGKCRAEGDKGSENSFRKRMVNLICNRKENLKVGRVKIQ